ncbi:MAG: hypothetical protein Q4B58_00730 [Bacteroidales bacterium]|nr:hypothetical protein [Bacteroidales bacterium]
MIIQQLSIRIENQSGASWRVFQNLADKGVNILSYSIEHSPEFGMLRLLVDNVKTAEAVLSEQGFTIELTPVYTLNVPNEPGSMSSVLKHLYEHNISLDFLYAFQYRGISQAVLHAQDMETLEEVMTAYERKLFSLN